MNKPFISFYGCCGARAPKGVRGYCARCKMVYEIQRLAWQKYISELNETN